MTWIVGEKSPISSRKMVPFSATSSRPFLFDSALVNAGGSAPWDPAERHPRLIPSTFGVFDSLAGLSSDKPLTVLRYIGEYQVPVSVFAWFAHRDIRRGFEARLCAMMAASRVDDVFSRRVIVPQYFDREARISLGESLRPDDADLKLGAVR